jgi:hypothetical protein
VTPYTLLCGPNVLAFATAYSVLHYLNTSDDAISYSLPYNINISLFRHSLLSHLLLTYQQRYFATDTAYMYPTYLRHLLYALTV